MNRVVICALFAGIVGGAAFAKPSISAATAEIAMPAGELTFAYTVKEGGWKTGTGGDAILQGNTANVCSDVIVRGGEIYTVGELGDLTVWTPSSGSTTTWECRIVRLHLFETSADATDYVNGVRKLYPNTSLCGEGTCTGLTYGLWTKTFYDSIYVSNGKHTITFDMADEFGLTATEFLSAYPEAVALAEVYDNCNDTVSYKQVPITSVYSVPSRIAAVYKLPHVLTGVCYDQNANPCGTVTVSFGAVKKETGAVRVTATIAPFSGSKTKVVKTVIVNEEGVLSGTLKFKSPFGVMSFAIDNAQSFELKGENYSAVSANIGGAFDADELVFRVDRSGGKVDFGELEELEVLKTAGEPVYVKRGTKFSFDKVPTIRYVRVREADGTISYKLSGLDDAKATNGAGLALTYAAKTGVFKGSFYIYASNACCTEGKPTLKKIKASVHGVVIEGVGVGTATAKFGFDVYLWNVTLKDR